MKHLALYFSVFFFFTVFFGCEKPNDSEKILNDSLINEIEVTTASPKKIRVFHSDAHEKDYNDLISGKLSISELKKKYNSSKMISSNLSDEKLMAIFKGEMNLDELGLTVKEQEQIIQKSTGFDNPRSKAKTSEKLSNRRFSNNRQLAQTTAQDVLDIWINYKGNCWWPANWVKIKVPSNKNGTRLYPNYLTEPDGWYRPYYWGDHLNLKVTPEIYEAHYVNHDVQYITLSVGWFPDHFSRKLPIRPGQISGYTRVDYDFYAWFKLFWVEYYIIARITEG